MSADRVGKGGFDAPAVEATHRMGAIPVIKRFLDRLQLASIMNELRPMSPQADCSRGEILVALVANKLLTPRPLYQLIEWGKDVGIERMLGIHPENLTDDRVARVLDDVADNVEALKREVCLSAIQAFGLDVGRLHWDLTSVVFEGDYDNQHPLWPLITYGYDPRATGKQKQVRVANLVAGDGAVGGLLHKTYSGNQSDTNTVTDYLQLFCEIRDRLGQKPRLIGDTKLLSPSAMVQFEDAGLWWICPEPNSRQLEQLYKHLPESDWKRIDYITARDANKPIDERTIYLYQEAEWIHTARVPAEPEQGVRRTGRPTKWQDKVYTFRRIFVFSSEEQKARRASRSEERTRLERDLGELQRKFATVYWKRQSSEAARKAVERALERRSVGKLYWWQVGAAPEGGWSLEFGLDEVALRNLEALDGYYSLVTNVPNEEVDGERVFRDWKQQSEVERRFADWKGPLRVRPLFLKHNKRIVGLVALLSIALLVFCLIEREARAQLKESNERMVGLLPVNRPIRATGRNVLQRLASLTAVRLRVQQQIWWQVSPPDPVQIQLLNLFGLEVDYILPPSLPDSS